VAAVIDQSELANFPWWYAGLSTDQGFAPIRKIISQQLLAVSENAGPLTIYTYGGFGPSTFETSTDEQKTSLHRKFGGLDLLAASRAPNVVRTSLYGQDYYTLPVFITMKRIGPIPDQYQLVFSLKQAGLPEQRLLLPIGGGLYPANDWFDSEIVTTNLRLFAADRPVSELSVTVQTVRGVSGLNEVGSVVLAPTVKKILGPRVVISAAN
jgi:hypothetical protein